MKIAIIGAGIAGLSAGQALARNGHEVHVYEKSRGVGGRMATRYSDPSGEYRFDHGIGFFSASSDEFSLQVDRWHSKGLVKSWGDQAFRLGSEGQMIPFLETVSSSGTPTKSWFTSSNGMNLLAKEMSRVVHVHYLAHVSGITYYGTSHGKKKPWLLNFQDSNMVEADAVIVATPAPQAYGILNTCHDEVDTYRIIREIDVVRYLPTFTVMALVDPNKQVPWSTLFLDGPRLQMISHESRKHAGLIDENETTLRRYILHSTHKAAQKAVNSQNRDKDWFQLQNEILADAAKILGDWIQHPSWSQSHGWRYAECENPLPHTHITNGRKEAPLAVIGDYFQGSSIEDSYLSGIACAKDELFK